MPHVVQANVTSGFLKPADCSSCFHSSFSNPFYTSTQSDLKKWKSVHIKILLKALQSFLHCSQNKARTSWHKILVIWHLATPPLAHLIQVHWLPFCSLVQPLPFSNPNFMPIASSFSPNLPRFFSCFSLSSNVYFSNRSFLTTPSNVDFPPPLITHHSIYLLHYTDLNLC